MGVTPLSAALVALAGLAAPADAGIPQLPPTWIVYEAGATEHSEVATQIVAGPNGSVTVLGSAFLPSTSEDVLVIRYSADGVLEWQRRFDTPEHGDEHPGAIVAAPDGGAWFSTQHASTPPRISVTRLDADGEVVWSESRSVAPSRDVFAFQLIPKLAVDLDHGAPRVYVTVSDAGAYRVLRFDDDGAEVWDVDWTAERTGGTPPEWLEHGHRPTDIDVGAGGDVYVTGVIADSVTTGGAYGTIAVAPEGSVRWTHFQSGDLGALLTDPFVRAHPEGGAVVAGSPETTCGTFDLRLWSISDEGIERWDVPGDDDPCGFTFGPTSFAVAPDGRAAVCSSNVVPLGWRTRVLDADGAVVMDRLWDASSAVTSLPMAVAFDLDGGVVVTGTGNTPTTGFGVVRYDGAGDESWQWTASPSTTGMGVSLDVGDDGACFVAARRWGGAGVGEHVATLRFDPPRAPCLADFDGSGGVDGADLAIVLGAWGSCGDCAADLNHDGAVDGSDLAIVLGAWGDC